MKKVIEIKPIEIRPIEDSANGKTNAFSHCCMLVGHFRSYATCLHLIKERESGRLDVLYSDCSASIGKKSCPAISMRQEEVAAGHALYFQERIKNLGNAFLDVASDLLNSAVKPFKEIKVKSPVTIVDEMQPDMGGYSDAINNALKNGVVPVELAKVPELPKAKEGESLIELAKRMMLAKA